jgi:tartrate dehydrogenase/decarboxylase / D-malate dehydrogenase
MTAQTIAVTSGGGIGPEVIDSTCAVLDAVSTRHAIDLSYNDFDWSCQLLPTPTDTEPERF